MLGPPGPRFVLGRPIYSHAEWRRVIVTDEDGFALEPDSVLAARHHTTRQTIHAVRKKLGIKSATAYKRTHEPARDQHVGLQLTQPELEAADRFARLLGLSRSCYLGMVGALPGAAALLAAQLGRELPAAGPQVGIAEPPSDVAVDNILGAEVEPGISDGGAED